MSKHAVEDSSSWRSFWNKGGWWRSTLLVAAWLVVFLLGTLAIVAVGRSAVEGVTSADVLKRPAAITVTLVLPEVVGALAITLFVASVAWFPSLFRRRQRSGSWWMWIAPITVVLASVARLIGTDWSAYGFASVVLIFVLGILVGYTEELLTRGAVVKMLREGGYGQRGVLLLSSLLFALMHLVTGLGGGASDVKTVAATVVNAFVFGGAMYLTLLVTGSLVWPILLHALNDPTTFLQVGGVDSGTASGGWASAGAIAFFVYAILFVVALFALPKKDSLDPVHQ